MTRQYATSEVGVPEAAAVAEIVAEHIKPQLVSLSRGTDSSTAVLVLPKGLAAQSIKPFLDEYLPRPERRKGTARLQDIDSFIEHVNRFKDADSALFADRNMEKPSIQAVLDYHQNPNDDERGASAEPRFGQHRAAYAFPLSDEWNAWKAMNSQAMTQAEFAEFLEDRIGDVIAPPDMEELAERAAWDDAAAKKRDLIALLGGHIAGPSRLMDLSRGLSVRVNQSVKNAQTLASGETTIVFAAEHQDQEGQPLRVPNMFTIAIPVFEAGPLYEMMARLRYRVRGTISWFYELYRPEKVFEHAFKEACWHARDTTELPLLFGHPES